MKPVDVSYVRARSVEHALEALLDGDAKLLAGGHSLLPMMNFRLAAPEILVDIDGLVSLDRVVASDDEVLLGALIRHQRLVQDPAVSSRLPLLSAAAQHIGHLAIRNRGTLGGSLAHADATAELSAACLALGASVVCDRAGGRRREIAIDDFLQGMYTTVLEPDEMITWVRIPVPTPGAGWGFREFAPREGDFAIAGACALVDADRVRVVVFGVEQRPRAFELERSVWEDDPVSGWIGGLEPFDEPDFRRDVAETMVRRAVADATERTAHRA